MENLIKYLPILIPSIMGYTSAIVCMVGQDSGKIVKFRPPPAAFSVVWSVLYLLLGISWYLARQQPLLENYQGFNVADVLYLTLNIILCLWVYVYSCRGDKKNGIYVIVLSIIFAMMCYTICGDIRGKLAIVPLMGWLFLATLLNVFEVEELN